MNNQYTLHLLPEPHITKDITAHVIIGTFTGKEGDIWVEGKDFQFSERYVKEGYGEITIRVCGQYHTVRPTRIVAIPITQPVEETNSIPGKREFIICSAIHYRDGIVRKEQPLNIKSGIVVCGRRHNNCVQTLEEIKGFDIGLIDVADLGFLTSNNEFKTRKEAMIIAVREKQIYHNVPYSEGDILTSEDLWLDND